MPLSISGAYGDCDYFANECPNHLKSTKLKDVPVSFKPSKLLSATYENIIAITTGIREIMKNCSKPNFKKCLRGKDLYNTIINTVTITKRGVKYSFNENGDMLDCVEIHQIFITEEGNYTIQGNSRKKITLHTHPVFRYMILNDTLLELNNVQWPKSLLNGRQNPESVCSSTKCPVHFRLQSITPCCFTCIECSKNEISQDEKCIKCNKYQEASKLHNFTQCIDLEEVFLHDGVFWGSLYIGLSIIFPVLYFIVCHYLWKFRRTRIMSQENFASVYIILAIGNYWLFFYYFAYLDIC